ncbi:MAG TPA: hypothetical protein DCQ25_09515 [Elusimicrobia bacterium]|nr:hypothetical protein [Elusimicrobiota bacterium]
MFRKAMLALVLVSSVSALVSAEIKFDTLNNTSLQQEISAMELTLPEAAPVAAEDKAAQKEWTIMVFINAKNNLERYGLLDVNEMEKVGSSDKVNIVVEMGRINGYASNDGDWKTTRRYLVKKDNDFSKITSPVLADLGKTDMGDYKSLAAFANWAKTTYPAKRYMLIVWNHGAGWIKARGMNDPKGISYDDETGNHITTPQFGMAMKAIGKVDVIGTDACLMQMPEVNYEIKDYVDYIVASEETEPGDGYTYDTFLGPVVAKPTMTPREVGAQAVNAYSDHYGSQDHTQSLVLASAMNGFIPMVNNFVKAAMAANEKALIKTAMSGAQAYAYAENKDLWHFLSLYAASSKDANVKATAKTLQDYITNTLVLVNRTNSSYSDSHGIAIYMPNYVNSSYASLAWSRDAQWDEFIAWYTAK